jgi:hypothetical protein
MIAQNVPETPIGANRAFLGLPVFFSRLRSAIAVTARSLRVH